MKKKKKLKDMKMILSKDMSGLLKSNIKWID